MVSSELQSIAIKLSLALPLKIAGEVTDDNGIWEVMLYHKKFTPDEDCSYPTVAYVVAKVKEERWEYYIYVAPAWYAIYPDLYERMLEVKIPLGNDPITARVKAILYMKDFINLLSQD